MRTGGSFREARKGGFPGGPREIPPDSNSSFVLRSYTLRLFVVMFILLFMCLTC